MSSSEEYLDSLLDSILGGGKPNGEEEVSSGMEGRDNQPAPADGGKAMSSQEIEDMLVSMGTLGGTEEEKQEQGTSGAEDMEAMLAFMNEHNAGADNSPSDAGALLPDEPLPGGQGMEEEMPEGLDGLSLDALDLGESGGDGAGAGDLSLDDLSLDDLGIEEEYAGGSAPEETGGGDGAMLDDLSLDDLDLGEGGGDGAGTGDLSLDDLSLDGLGTEEGTAGDFALEETGGGDGAALDDLSLDDLSLDDLDLGESDVDGAGTGDLSLDDLSLDDLGTEEGTAGDFALEETGGGDDAALDDLSLDDLSLDDLDLGGNDAGMDDLSLENPKEADGETDGLMSEEDIDRLLNGDLSGEGSTDDFALEETGESDEDLSALLAGMDHDEDLSEINDLLEGADHGVSPDDDMLAMLEGADDGSFDFFESDEAAREAESIRELTPEEIAAREGGEKPKKEKKKRKKLFGKKKADKPEESAEEATEGIGDELEALLGEGIAEEPGAEREEEEKKPGFFAKLMNFLLEADEEDEDPVAEEVLADSVGETGRVTEENREILQELKDEDKKGKKKKKKDKKKGKKGKEGEGEEGEEAAEEEEDSKKEKKRKKKEKKKKDEEEVDLFAPPEKKLSKKKVITVFVFCGTIAACIVLLSSFLPNYTEKREAHVAYDHQDYAGVYDLLYGKKLNEQDEILFRRSNLILQMGRKLTSYDNYVNLDMRLEALNALISGVARYQEILPEAETYNVVSEVNDIYGQILERLSADFGVSESDAMEIIASEDDVTYSQKLEAIINGTFFGEDVPAGRQDVLPEEEEIIERIDGLETEGEQQTDIQADVAAEEDMLPEEMQDQPVPADENRDEGAE